MVGAGLAALSEVAAILPLDDESIEAFTAHALAEHGGCGSADPIFIVGMPRSGTTLVEQVLAAHPAVAPGGELDLLPRIVAGPLAPFPGSLASLDAARCEALSGHYRATMLGRLSGNGAGKRYATDKRPDNYLLIGLIKRLFPDARIVHTLRNPGAPAVILGHNARIAWGATMPYLVRALDRRRTQRERRVASGLGEEAQGLHWT